MKQSSKIAVTESLALLTHTHTPDPLTFFDRAKVLSGALPIMLGLCGNLNNQAILALETTIRHGHILSDRMACISAPPSPLPHSVQFFHTMLYITNIYGTKHHQKVRLSSDLR
jgi:hypothetical protein